MKVLFGSICLTAMLVGLVATLMMLTITMEPITEDVIEKAKEWNVVAGPSPANFAGGSVTGIVFIGVHVHWANGSYDDNMSDIIDCYAFNSNQYNTSLGGNVPASTAFDIVITARISNDDIVNGSAFQLAAGSAVSAADWARMNLTCPHTTPAIGALTAASGRRNITDQSLGDPIDAFVNFYWNNSGSGYQIGNGVSANVTAFTLEIYS